MTSSNSGGNAAAASESGQTNVNAAHPVSQKMTQHLEPVDSRQSGASSASSSDAQSRPQGTLGRSASSLSSAESGWSASSQSRPPLVSQGSATNMTSRIQQLVRGAALLGRGSGGEEDASGSNKGKKELGGESGSSGDRHEGEDDELTTDSGSDDDEGASHKEEDVEHPALSPEEHEKMYEWPPFGRENSTTTLASSSRKQSNANTIRGGEEPVVTPSEIIGGQETPLTNLQVQAIFQNAEAEEKEEAEGGGKSQRAKEGGAESTSSPREVSQASEAQNSRKRHKRDALKQEWYRLTRAHAKYIPHLQKSHHTDRKKGDHTRSSSQGNAEEGQQHDDDEEASHSLNQSLSFLEEDSQLAAHLDQQAFDELEQEQESNPLWSKLLRRGKPAKKVDPAAAAAAGNGSGGGAGGGSKGGRSGAATTVPSKPLLAPAPASASPAPPPQVARSTSDATTATSVSMARTSSEESTAMESGVSPVSGSAAAAEEEQGQKLSLDDSTAVGSSDERGDSMDSLEDKKTHLRRETEPSEHFLVLPSIDPAKKLEALKEEFGELKCSGELLEELGEEKYLADVPTVLIRTVLIKGTLMLTNHRLCFLAYLPSFAELQRIHRQADRERKREAEIAQAKREGKEIGPSNDEHEDPEPEDDSFAEEALVIKKGPATEHRPGWAPRRRLWLELRTDSLSFYPSSEKLYEPIGSIRFGDIEEVHPIDWRKPTWVSFRSSGQERSLEYGTEEAALQWRKEIEAAIWKFRHTAEKVLVSLPLARIKNIDQFAFLSFATCISVIVQEDHVAKPGDRGDPDNKDVTEVTFGLTSAHITFRDVLLPAVEAANKIKARVGWEETLDMTARPAISLDGPMAKEYDEWHHKDDLAIKAAQEAGDDVTALKAARFIREFSLRDDPELRIFRAELVRTLPALGSLSIGGDYLCFWRRRLGSVPDTKFRIPITDLVSATPSKAFKWHSYGLTLHIKGHPDLIFELHSVEDRDQALALINKLIEEPKTAKPSDQEMTKSNSKDQSARMMAAAATQYQPVMAHGALNYLPKLVNPGAGVLIRVPPMRVCIPVIGSRGDIQPFIGLGKGLQSHGHTVCIVSHPEYEGWVTSHGLEYRHAGGDPGALMKLAVEHRLFSPAFFRESVGKFRAWLDELMRQVYEGCYDADMIIEAPQTMAGIHVAERLGVPYFRAFTMPWTRTSAYPQAFSVPPVDMGPSYNSMSYTIFDQVFWRATSGQVNRWRKHMLGLKPTDFTKLNQSEVPFLYNFSEAVVPVPNDWDDHISVTGYWFLDTLQSEWQPPQELQDFLEKARKDDKKIAYCGFGSIVVDNPEELSSNLYQAVKEADVRAIIAKGWSGRMSHKDDKDDKKKDKKDKDDKDHEEDEKVQDAVEPPEECFVVDSIPHDWLFPKIDIALHHGGAGTTGASLRAGLVTLIKPFFGDQFFWAQRVHKLGAGMRVASLNTNDLVAALKKAAESRIMVEKASQVGERIRNEHGVENAISFLHANINRARRHPDFREEKKDKKQAVTKTSTSHSLLSMRCATSPERAPARKSTSEQVSDLSSSPVEGLSRSGTSESSTARAENQNDEARADSDRDPTRKSSILPSFSLPSLPSLPGLPKSSTLHNMSLASALKQIVKDDDDNSSMPKRIDTDDTFDQDDSPSSPTSKRTYMSAKLEDKRRAAALAPKLEKLALARKAAQRVEKTAPTELEVSG